MKKPTLRFHGRKETKESLIKWAEGKLIIQAQKQRAAGSPPDEAKLQGITVLCKRASAAVEMVEVLTILSERVQITDVDRVYRRIAGKWLKLV
jgi:hypothetical protein